MRPGETYQIAFAVSDGDGWTTAPYPSNYTDIVTVTTNK